MFNITISLALLVVAVSTLLNAIIYTRLAKSMRELRKEVAHLYRVYAPPRTP